MPSICFQEELSVVVIQTTLVVINLKGSSVLFVTSQRAELFCRLVKVEKSTSGQRQSIHFLNFRGVKSYISHFHQVKRYSSDAAKIYSIHVTNVMGGVATQCRRCALSSAQDHSACVPCPAGHYMVSGTGECKSCPPNSIVRAEDPVGESACVPCGPNTQRNEVT